MVPKASATFTGVQTKPYQVLRLEGDHRSMVKFESQITSGYQRIKGKIQKTADVAVEQRIHKGMLVLL